jgi:hypothetical protein
LIKWLLRIGELLEIGCSLSQGIGAPLQELDRITVAQGFYVLPSRRSATRAAATATRACRSFALARIASSMGGQYFSWSAVSCNAALTIVIRASAKVLTSAALKRSGALAEGVCA